MSLVPVRSRQAQRGRFGFGRRGTAPRRGSARRHVALTFTAATVLCLALLGQRACAAGLPPSGWNDRAAASYLDERTSWWMHDMGAIDHGTSCVSCHTALPYALARSALRRYRGEREPTLVERQLLDSVSKRVREADLVQPFLSGPNESRGTESVLNALVLVTYDAPGGKLGEDTRLAFDTMWARQLKSGPNAGSWPWFSLGNEPWEAPDSRYWGAAVAALAVGSTSPEYQSEPEVQSSLVLLRAYLLRDEQGQSLFNRLSLLHASTKLAGLLSLAEQQSIVNDVVARQHPDGGWSASDLVLPSWKRNDGSSQGTKSDSYATAYTAFVLEQTGRASARSPVSRARSWLISHQVRDGCFRPASSWNKQRDPRSDVGQFMTDAATAYAVLALTSRR